MTHKAKSELFTTHRLGALLLVSVAALAFGCGSPSKQSLTALSASWQALSPYTVQGIEAAELSDDAKDVLKDEVEEFGALLEEELKHAQ